MKLIFFFLFILPSFAFAFCEDYTRSGEEVRICWKNEIKAYVNSKCDEGCSGEKFLKGRHSKPKLKLSGGVNPSSAVCEFHQLKVTILKDPRGAGQSFCEFADGSLIDSNAVARSLR